ncbi:MAG: AMP-binding protein [Planctomycetota bacterium]|nr:AMP-binding protein [Planctomycetota bacterium]
MDVWRLLERAADRWPDRLAVVDGELHRTYAGLRARAAGLAATLELAPGDRVAYLGRNSAAYLEATFAAAASSSILVPLNTRLAPAELALILADAQPRLTLADEDLADKLPAGQRRRLTGDWGDGTFEPEEVAPDDPVHLYYTSGTTGAPKGVVLTQRNVLEHALAATSELDIADDDVWGHVAPMFHLADAWANLAITGAGGRHVIAPRFDAREVLDLFAREGVTITNLVPTMLVRLVVEAEQRGPGDLALRQLLSGGAPIAPDTVERLLAVFGCEYTQTYGLTETSPFLTLGLLQPHHRELDAAQQLALRCRTGRAFETVEVEVVDDEGEPVANDDRAVGEIRARGTTVSPGYWNRPEETALAHRDGWFYTGDLATIDEEGYLRIVDRRKDMILTGGENVFSIEVEDVLTAHPAVLEAAVYGRPDPEWGERVCAAVVLERPAEISELEAHCRQHLAGYKCPRLIEVREELPRTGSGKLSKAQLRDERG